VTEDLEELTAWQVGNDWEEFASVARGYLAREPERNTLPITVLDAVISGRFRDPPPTFGWHRRDSSIDGAFLVTPPYELIVVGRPDAVRTLGRQLRRHHFAVSGVNAEPDTAKAFCSTYLERAEITAELRTHMLLYRLEGLVEPPIPAEGACRVATDEDFELCLNWFNDMRAEIGEGNAGDQTDLVERRIAGGLVWLWETNDEVVSLASRAPDAAGVARIGPVYTPPRWRRHGFASAITHACARDAIERGASGVVLFTDLANPTSNAIYQAIGFRRLGERVVMAFGTR
jgi:predicted GNAT family acetyltransferase